jgi:hypothetical protein
MQVDPAAQSSRVNLSATESCTATGAARLSSGYFPESQSYKYGIIDVWTFPQAPRWHVTMTGLHT